MERPTPASARAATDAAFAERLMTQPEDALGPAWRRFRPLVRQVLRKMLGPDEEVRDLSQEAFVQFSRSVRGLRKADAIRPFVAGIAARLALEEIRRRRVRGRQVLVPGQGLIRPRSTSPDHEAREAMGRLYAFLGRLRDQDRDLFVMRQIQGLEQSEIAALTNQSVSTVRRRLQRLQKRLDRLIETDPALAAYAVRLVTPRRRSSRAGHASSA